MKVERAAVLFDVGNTLLHLDYPRMADAVGKATGRQLPAAALLAAGYAGRRAVEEALARGALTDAQRYPVFVRALLQDAGLAPDLIAPAMQALRREDRRRSLYSAVPPGTGEALERLRSAGYVVGAVSNSDGTVADLLTAGGLRDRLAFVIDSGLVGVEKPDPRIFRLGLTFAGVPATNAWYVGDIYSIDVIGARAAGMEAILIDPLGRYGHLDCRTAPDVAAVPELVGLPPTR